MFEELKEKAKFLYNSKDYGPALDLYEELKKIDPDKFEKQCIFSYMWCLYRLKLNNEEAFNDKNINQTREIVKYILDHQSNKDLLYQVTVLCVLKNFEKKQNLEADKVNYWLDKLDPNLLSEEVFRSEYEGKQVESMSNKEKWYALKSKVCEKIEMYSECMRVSQEALDKINKFHNDNDIWFRRRIAKSMAKLGRQDEAINTLTDILKTKKDWFIYQDIGDIYLAQYNYKAARDNYLNAILAPGDDSMKIKLFWQMGNVLDEIGDSEDEILLKSYSIKIRTEHEWKLSKDEKDFEVRNKDYIDTSEARALKRKINDLAQKYKWQDSIKLEGTISKILSEGKAGFIRTSDGSYYFRMNQIRSRGANAQIGARVSFYLEKGFDKKKGIEIDNAVNISFRE